MTNDSEQSESKRVRIPIDIPLSCITNPTPTPSDIELLTRLFPNERRFLLEMVLQGCYGNILHAIQVISRSSSTSPGTSNPMMPMQGPSTTIPPTTPNTESALRNLGNNFLNNTYRYLYPGYLPPPSYVLPGSPGMGFFRPYLPNLSTATPGTLQANCSTICEPAENEALSAQPTCNNKEYESLDMTPSPSPKREEIEHVCLKCKHKQRNSKICERCGQHSNVIVNVNHVENMS